MPKCRSCGAPVVWVETVATEKRAGRKMPLDADPARPEKALRVDDGRIVPERDRSTGALLRSGDGTPLVRLLPKTVELKSGGFRSHFASCPDARKHRRSA